MEILFVITNHKEYYQREIDLCNSHFDFFFPSKIANQAIQCSHPGNPMNANLMTGISGLMVGATQMYVCMDDDHRPCRGNATIVCTYMGEWSDIPLQCGMHKTRCIFTMIMILIYAKNCVYW